MVDSVQPWDKTCSACHSVKRHTVPAGTHAGNDTGAGSAYSGYGCEGLPGMYCHDISDVSQLHANVHAGTGGCVTCHGEGVTPTTACVTCHEGGWGGDVSYMHHNNIKYLNDPADAAVGDYYAENPPGGWNEALTNYDCQFCHTDYFGITNVPPDPIPVYAGAKMWYAGLRSTAGSLNDTTLQVETMTVPASATLEFMTNYSAESGKDYGYVEVSTDGVTWDSIAGDITTTSDPNGLNLGNGINGMSGGWIPATFDLSAYAGQEAAIRFRYVTDRYYNYAGLAIDDIAITDGTGTTVFSDDAESDNALLTSVGWLRVGAYPPPYQPNSPIVPDRHDATAGATELADTGASCADCHDTSLLGEHAKPTSSSAASSCAACHPTPKTALAGSWDGGCVEDGCHAVGSATEMHSGLSTAHQVPGASASCLGNCHETSLTTEHARTTGGRTAVSCNACHAKVLTLVNGWDGTCVACHATLPHSNMTQSSNADCEECHSVSASYASSAHGMAVTAGSVASVDTGRQCEACHDHRSDEATGHVAYRTGLTPAVDDNQSKLCFRCHSADSAETASVGTAPFAWNGRDVKAEFARTSSHPINAGGTDVVTETVVAMEQDRYAEFAADTFVNATLDLGSNTPRLADASWVVTFPAAPRLLAQVADTTNESYWLNKTSHNYNLNTGVWNGDEYEIPMVGLVDPHGSDVKSVFMYKGKVHQFMLNTVDYVWRMYRFEQGDRSNPGTWTDLGTGPGFYGPGGEGGEVAVDEAHSSVYWDYGSNSLDVFRRNMDSGAADSVQLKASASEWMNLGTGASIAYSPQTDKLFIINRNGQNPVGGSNAVVPNGRLYTIDSPSTVGSPAMATDTGVFVTNGGDGATGNTTVSTRMQRATIGGSDYLFVMGRNGTNVDELQIVSGLGDTSPTVTSLGLYPWGAGTPDSHLELAWDGGQYLYSAYGNVIKRILIPSDPVAGAWGEWEQLPAAPSSPDGYALSFLGSVQPPDRTHYGYEWTGSVSTEVNAPALASSWGALSFKSTAANGTRVTVSVEGWDGSSFLPLPGLESTSGPIDLSALSTAQWSKLRVVATMDTSSDRYTTPRLSQWKVTAKRTYPGGTMGTRKVVQVGAYDPAPAYLRTDSAVVVSEALAASTLTTGTVSRPFPGGPLMYQFFRFSNLTKIAQYDPATNEWNGGWDPQDLTGFTMGANALSGSTTLQALGSYEATTYRIGRVDWTPGLPPASTFTSAPTDTMPYNGVVDSAHNVVYIPYSYNNGTNPTTIKVMDITTQQIISTFSVTNFAGKPFYLGTASSVAYSPELDRLWLIDKNSYGPWLSRTNTGDGYLYYIDAPRSQVGTITATRNTEFAWPYVADYDWLMKLQVVNRGGHDYLFGLQDQSVYKGGQHWRRMVVARSGSSTVTIAPWPTSTSVGLAIGSTPQFETDGQDRLYAWDNGTGRFTSRIDIPADPLNASSWPAQWSTIPTSPLVADGYGTIKFLDTPAGLFSQVGTGYPSQAESRYSTVAQAPAESATWGGAAWVASNISGVATATVTLEGWNGSEWVEIPGFSNMPGSSADLSGLSATEWTKLRLRGDLSTSDPYRTPRITNWSITCGNGEGVYLAPEAIAESGADRWKTASWAWSDGAPADSYAQVRGWNGSSYVPIPGFTNITQPGSIDLTSLSVDEWPKLQFALRTKTDGVGTLPTLPLFIATAEDERLERIGSMTCVSCHNAHSVAKGDGSAWDMSRVSDPRDTSAPMSTVGDGSTTDFCLRCHTSEAVAGGATVPYTVGFSSPLEGISFAGWNKDVPGASFKQSGHYTTGGTKATCETCHDPHGSDNSSLLAWTKPDTFAGGTVGERDNRSGAAFEENLCLQCHGNGTVGKAAPGAQDVASSMSSTYGHPTTGIQAVHRDTETTEGVGVGNRHAECVDCHDAHAAQPGTHTTGTAVGGAMRGATGVVPAWSDTPGESASSYSPIRLTGDARDAEAYVCFKCHTSVTSLPTTGGSNGRGASDLSREFNPNNASYHNVLGIPGGGVRTSFTAADGYTIGLEFWNNLKPGWTPNSAMTCSDCHSSGSVAGAKGPHGSSQPFMMDPEYSGSWESAKLYYFQSGAPSPSNLICTKCHDMSSKNPIHNVQNHWGGSYTGDQRKCISCHVRIPHGWVRPRLIGYVTDPPQYRSESVVGFRFKTYLGSGYWVVDACSANCAPHPSTQVEGIRYWK
ncbi:MAG: hypothetical protein HGB10_11445 [Coriobacteriia bacterium]|nr:hypothetical protein [Coriobacteriia bacterium]